MVLERIVADKRALLEERYPTRVQTCPEGLIPSVRSLEDALRKERTGFIFECKKASPSKGLIRPAFDVAEIARAYAPFADAISVLTDEKYFQGHLDYLKIVSENADVPVLCKDFILEPFQIVQARQAGGDAVLLMLSVLDDAQFANCFEMAEKLKMDALVEVRDEAELERAIALGARIIGINNRNLDTLKIDMDATRRLAPLVPKDKVVVCESGISDHAQVREFRHQVNGFLVGSSVMAQDNIIRACGALVYGRVKVCGLTERRDMIEVASRGVSFGGLIFVKESKRYVDISKAQLIVKDVELPFVGVFADAPTRVVADTANCLKLHAVQLHGDEDAAYIEQLRALLNEGVEVWKAVKVTDTLPVLNGYGDCRILFDAKVGGSGEVFDWTLLDGLDASKCLLAGGLGVENATAAGELGFYALDVNSRVEVLPGKKDMTKLDAFLAELR